MTQAFLLYPLVLTALVRSLAIGEGSQGTEGNLYNNEPRVNGKLLGMRGDRLMAHTSLWCGLYAAFAWREEGPIAAWIVAATWISYAEHTLRHEFLTWLDRVAAVSLGIALYLRMRRLPRACHLGVAVMLWATCDISSRCRSDIGQLDPYRWETQ